MFLASSKLWLNGAFSRNTLANISISRTSAQEIGLLSFNNIAEWVAEAAIALLRNRLWAIGAEFRQKPGVARIPESNWRDFFVAWFPEKGVSTALPTPI